MLYQRIEIVGYSLKSIGAGRDECRVCLELSDRPPKGWRKIFRAKVADPSSQVEGAIEPRLKLSGNHIRLSTKGDFVQDDLEQLVRIVGDVGDDFEQGYEAAIESQRQIANFLEEKFPGEMLRF